MYKRVLVKLSGEALGGENGFGLSVDAIQSVIAEIKSVCEAGVQVGIVVGGGNLFRGIAGSARGMGRASADHIGMLGTLMNALALMDCLETAGVPARVQSGLTVNQVAEPFIRRKAIRHFEKNRVVIFGGGTGNPYFSTDTAAALRANEIEASVVLKATKVNGVYDADPKKYPNAKRFKQLSYADAIRLNLGVMDASAFSLCRDNKMPIVVFNAFTPGNLLKVVRGDMSVGTLVSDCETQFDE